MDITIQPGKLCGTVAAIPSKSQAHRLLICAALADKETTLLCPQTNQDIEVTVLEIRGDQVKLGIKAPKQVPIYRKEVYLQIQKENEAAASVENLAALKKLL